MNTSVKIVNKDVLRERAVIFNPTNGQMEPMLLLEASGRNFLPHAFVYQNTFSSGVSVTDDFLPSTWTGIKKIYMDLNRAYHGTTVGKLTQSGVSPHGFSFLFKPAEVTNLHIDTTDTNSVAISGTYDMVNKIWYSPFSNFSGWATDLGAGWSELRLSVGTYGSGEYNGLRILMEDGVHAWDDIPGDGVSGFYIGGINSWENQRFASSFIFNTEDLQGYPSYTYGAGRAQDIFELSCSNLVDSGAMSCLFNFIDLGSCKISGQTYFLMGDWNASGAKVWLDIGVTGYRLNHYNGVDAAVNLEFPLRPAIGDNANVLWQISGNGSMNLNVSLNAAPFSGVQRTGAYTIHSLASKRVFMNSYGVSGQGFIGVKNFVLMNGIQDQHTLESAV